MHLLYMFLRHSVLTVTFIHHRMVKMLSIGLVKIKNGMLRSFSSWRELMLTQRIRWELFNDNFTDPYHLYLYCIMFVIDDVCVYLIVYHIVIIRIHVNHFTRMDIYIWTLYAECCDSWIAVIQYRVDLPIHHHPNEPLVMSIQSTCPIWYYDLTHM